MHAIHTNKDTHIVILLERCGWVLGPDLFGKEPSLSLYASQLVSRFFSVVQVFDPKKKIGDSPNPTT